MQRGKAIRIVIAVASFGLGAAALIGGEVLFALYGFGSPEPFTNPSREPVHLGSGSPITLVVMGDSTAAGQGSPYESGIAMRCVRFLAQRHRVTLINLGVSGATTPEVMSAQLESACQFKPDIVLIASGANDATHFTASDRILDSAKAIVASLARLPNPPAVIVTGSPDLGSAPRFPQPLRWFAGTQTKRVNAVWRDAIAGTDTIMAPVVESGPIFARHPQLYNTDAFHPNASGYGEWWPIIRAALEQAEAAR
jgi:lysophospholipase L1-like esterase